jgi:Fic family protein
MSNIIETRIGKYVTRKTGDESYKAYIPVDLPPTPDIDIASIESLHSEACYFLGKLDSFNDLIPDIGLLVYMYVRKEALLSSQIEGTQSSFVEFLEAENSGGTSHLPGVLKQDIYDISNYIEAQDYGIERLQSLPLSLRLLREIHAVLLKKGRGSTKSPGEFRRSQNWIGGLRPSLAHFVPPPVDLMDDCLDNLEKFLYSNYPPLIKAAVAHVQFETIHPFLDGNGRLGRLLMTLILCHDGLLKKPILYLSLYLKTHRKEYYEMLSFVRETGQWEEWLSFFLRGVIETSKDAIQSAMDISDIFVKDASKIEKLHTSKQKSVIVVFELLKKRAVISLAEAVKITGLNYTPTSNAFKTLQDLGIVKEITGKKRNLIFSYHSYIDILSKDTDSIS